MGMEVLALTDSPAPRWRDCSGLLEGRDTATQVSILFRRVLLLSPLSARRFGAHLINFAGGEQECAGDVFMRAFTRCCIGPGIHLLAPLHLALRTDGGSQGGVRLFCGRQKCAAVENMVIDPPGESEGKKGGTAALRVGDVFRVIEVGAPESVGRLALN